MINRPEIFGYITQRRYKKSLKTNKNIEAYTYNDSLFFREYSNNEEFLNNVYEYLEIYEEKGFSHGEIIKILESTLPVTLLSLAAYDPENIPVIISSNLCKYIDGFKLPDGASEATIKKNISYVEHNDYINEMINQISSLATRLRSGAPTSKPYASRLLSLLVQIMLNFDQFNEDSAQDIEEAVPILIKLSGATTLKDLVVAKSSAQLAKWSNKYMNMDVKDQQKLFSFNENETLVCLKLDSNPEKAFDENKYACDVAYNNFHYKIARSMLLKDRVLGIYRKSRVKELLKDT